MRDDERSFTKWKFEEVKKRKKKMWEMEKMEEILEEEMKKARGYLYKKKKHVRIWKRRDNNLKN